MDLLQPVKFLLHITHSKNILRRYFVVNGFDGALTMLGLITGFLFSLPGDVETGAVTDFSMVINVCLAAAIALGMSGVSSAYVSETAERKHELGKLERAMIHDLKDSRHGSATRWVPLIVALVNGLAPLLISLLILLPLWLANTFLQFAIPPLYASIVVALLLVFLLGVFLGHIAGVSWLLSGIQTLLVALLTATLIYLFTGY